LGVVPFDPAAHDIIVGDLQPVLTVVERSDRQGATHLLDQSPEPEARGWERHQAAGAIRLRSARRPRAAAGEHIINSDKEKT
jgi:hypothetical protein